MQHDKGANKHPYSRPSTPPTFTNSRTSCDESNIFRSHVDGSWRDLDSKLLDISWNQFFISSWSSLLLPCHWWTQKRLFNNDATSSWTAFTTCSPIFKSPPFLHLLSVLGHLSNQLWSMTCNDFLIGLCKDLHHGNQAHSF